MRFPVPVPEGIFGAWYTAVDVFIASTKPWFNLEAKQKHKQTKENEKKYIQMILC